MQEMTSELSTNYLSPESFKKFCGCIKQASNAKLDSDRLKLLFFLMYYCALRVSEALNVSKPDINMTRRILRVPRAKTGKNQKTSIPKPLLQELEKNWDSLPEKIFDFSRQSVWMVGKKIGGVAGLNLFESQGKRDIEGVWTHLFRKSYAKWMQEQGADISLIKVKLRHTGSEIGATFTYIKPDINYLIKWEDDNFG